MRHLYSNLLIAVFCIVCTSAEAVTYGSMCRPGAAFAPASTAQTATPAIITWRSVNAVPVAPTASIDNNIAASSATAKHLRGEASYSAGGSGNYSPSAYATEVYTSGILGNLSVLQSRQSPHTISGAGNGSPTSLARWTGTTAENYEPSATVTLSGLDVSGEVGNGELEPVGDIIPVMLVLVVLFTLIKAGLRKKARNRR